MGATENDPRDMAYIAFYTAIVWYRELSAEQAIRIAGGHSNALRGQKLTPEIIEDIKKIASSPIFYNIDTLVKKHRVNKYDILEIIAGGKTNVEAITVVQTDRLLKRIKDIAENCTAVDCEKCPLDKIMCGEYTLCEILSDATVDGQGRLNLKRVRQMSDKCLTSGDLKGESVKKTYRLYKQADDGIHAYKERHPRERIQDIISLALLEYVERHKEA